MGKFHKLEPIRAGNVLGIDPCPWRIVREGTHGYSPESGRGVACPSPPLTCLTRPAGQVRFGSRLQHDYTL